jgi:hypothetical protein
VLLFYMDAPGKREELHDMARRLASVGCCVVPPDQYCRRTREYWLKVRNEAGFAYEPVGLGASKRNSAPARTVSCRVCRPTAIAMGQKAGEKRTAAAELQPTLPKPDRLLDVRLHAFAERQDCRGRYARDAGLRRWPAAADATRIGALGC